MDNLKNFIDNNREMFEECEFETIKVEKFLQISKRNRIKKITLSAICAAAVILGVIFGINTYMSTIYSVNYQNKLYLSQKDELVSKIYQTTIIERQELENLVRAVTFEAIPMTEQLPSELSQKQKAKIICEYNQTLLNALNEILSKLQTI